MQAGIRPAAFITKSKGAERLLCVSSNRKAVDSFAYGLMAATGGLGANIVTGMRRSDGLG